MLPARARRCLSLLLALTLSALPALAGGLKISDKALTTIFWVLGLVSTVFWVPPLLGGLRLLTRRPGKHYPVLGGINFVSALLWLALVKFHPIFLAGAAICGVIGYFLFDEQAGTSSDALIDPAPSTVATEYRKAVVDDPAAQLAARRRWAKFAAWGLVVAIIVGGAVTAHQREQEKERRRHAIEAYEADEAARRRAHDEQVAREWEEGAAQRASAAEAQAIWDSISPPPAQ